MSEPLPPVHVLAEPSRYLAGCSVTLRTAPARIAPVSALFTELPAATLLRAALSILDWLQNPDLRRRVTAGLNKGEARNALARPVFFNRLGELRDHSFAQQRHRASGLNLVTAAISYWNTIHLDNALTQLAEEGHPANPDLLQHLSPLGWEHINLTGDYTWPTPHRR